MSHSRPGLRTLLSSVVALAMSMLPSMPLVPGALMAQAQRLPPGSPCPVVVNKPYRSPAATTVYVVTSRCTKRPIFNPEVFLSHFDWKDVVFIEQWEMDKIPNDRLSFMPWGSRRTFENGSLLKTTDDDRVYLISNNEAVPIENEDAFKSLGYSFDQVEDVTSDTLGHFQKKNETIHGPENVPNFFVFKYPDNPNVYLLKETDGGLVKEHITSFEQLKGLFREDRLGILPRSETFPDKQPTSGDTTQTDEISEPELPPVVTPTDSNTTPTPTVEGISSDASSLAWRDATAPRIYFTSPDANAVLSGTVTLQAVASDNVGVTSVRFRIGSTTISADTSSPYSASLNTESFANGTYTLRAIAQDAAGNSRTATRTVRINRADTDAPNVSWTAPASGASLAGLVNLEATASDNIGVSSVQFRVGSTVVFTDSSAPFTTSLDTTAFANGTVTLTAVATDAVGNTANATRNVTIANPTKPPADTSAPTVSITAPASGAAVSGASVSVTVSASDNIGVASVEFRAGTALIGTDTSSPYGVTWNTTSLANGSVTLSAVARDAAGNQATASRNVTVSNTTTAPTSTGQVIFNGDFETGNLNQWDNVERCHPDRILVYSAATAPAGAPAPRQGQYAARFRVNDNDQGSNCEMDMDGLRAQLDSRIDLFHSGDERWEAWSVYVPTTNPNPNCSGTSDNCDNWMLFQEDYGPPWDGSPSIGWNLDLANNPKTIRMDRGEQYGHDSPGRAPLAMGRWVDFLVHKKFANTSSGGGFVEAWVDGTAMTFNASGCSNCTKLMTQTMHSSQTEMGFFLAAYRGTGFLSTLDMYFDGARVGTTRESVALSGTTTPPPTPSDTTAPTVSISAPAANATVSGSAVTFSATASDNVGVASVEFRAGSTVLTTDTSSPYSTTFTTLTIPNGSLTLTAIARDAAGNQVTATRTVTVSNTIADTTSPNVSFTAPAANATVSGSIAVSADASDNVGVASVEFRVGSTVIATDTSAPYSATLNTASLANGSVALSAIARDAAGNQATASRSVTVSNTTTPPPTSGQVVFTGDFETGNLNQWDDVERCHPDRILVYSASNAPAGAPAPRQGQYAARFRLNDNDQGSNCEMNMDGLRAQLGSQGNLFHSGDERWESWSVYVPTTNPNPTCSGTSESCENWSVFQEDYGPPWDGSPSIGWNLDLANNPKTFRIDRGEQYDHDQVGRLPLITGRWADFLVHKKFSNTSNGGGFVEAWIDGQPMTFNASGCSNCTKLMTQTMHSSQTEMSFFLAVYRATGFLSTYDLYFDAVRVGTTRESVELITDAAAEAARRADTTAPSVSISAPAANATISGSAVTFSATASDNVGVASVEFRAGTALIGTDTSSPYSVTLNSTSLVNGSITLTAIARDAAGNQTSATRVVTVSNTTTDTVLPTVSFTAPASGATVSGSAVSITASASDNVGVASVEFRAGSTVLSTDTSSPFAATLNSTSFANGALTLTAIARDAAGNQASVTRSVTVLNTIADTAAPTVSFTAPASGATVSGSVAVSASASDNVGVTSVEFRAGSTVLSTDTSSPYGATLDTTTLSNGAVTLTLIARDAAGNQASVTRSVTVSNTTQTPGSVTLNVSTTRSSCAAPCAVFFDATQTTGLSGATSLLPNGDYVNANFNWDFDSTNVDSNIKHKTTIGFTVAHVFEVPGTYQVSVRVRDAAGHTGTRVVPITVSAMSGNTYYIAANGADTNDCRSTSTPCKGWTKMRSLMATNATILFRRGDTFVAPSGSFDISTTGPLVLGAYGTGAAPILDFSSSGSDGPINISGPDVRLMDLQIKFPTFIWNGISIHALNSLLLRVETGGNQYSASQDEGGIQVYMDRNGGYIVDSKLHTLRRGYGMYGERSSYVALIGSTIDEPVTKGAQHAFRIQACTFASRTSTTCSDGTGRNIYVAENILDNEGGFDSGTYRGNLRDVVHVNNHSYNEIDITPQNTDSVEYVQNVLVEGNIFDSHGSEATGNLLIQAKHVTIRNNVFLRVPTAVSCSESPQLTPGWSCDEVVIQNNSQYAPAGHTHGMTIFLSGSDLTSANHVTLQNNILFDNKGTEQWGDPALWEGMSSASLIQDHNLTWAPNNSSFIRPSGTGNIYANPLFTTVPPTLPEHMMLQSGSPAINAGATTQALQDFRGVTRPLGSAFDIGAFEIQ